MVFKPPATRIGQPKPETASRGPATIGLTAEPRSARAPLGPPIFVDSKSHGNESSYFGRRLIGDGKDRADVDLTKHIRVFT